MSTAPTPFQARVLAAVPAATRPMLPTNMVAADADGIALALGTSSAAVTKALRALEAQGRVRNLGTVPGLTVDGWAAVDPEPAPAPEPDYDWSTQPSEYANAIGPRRAREHMTQVRVGVASLGAVLDGTLSGLIRDAKAPEMVAMIAGGQEQRAAIKALEDTITARAGAQMDLGREGVLEDGRAFKIRRGQNRKGWDHERWQHDARAAVLADADVPAEVVDPRTGELVNLHPVLTALQGVHGSTGPRVGALRAMGLDPEDYCETTPGAWGVEFTDPVQPNS